MDEDLCLSAEQLSHSVEFRVILFIKAVFCAVGIVATLYSLKRHGIKWLVHCNSKAVYVFHILWSLEITVSYMVVFLFEFIRLSISHVDPCAYTIPAALGITLRAIPVVGVVTQSFIMCAFAIERSISTIWPSKYEGVHRPYLGIALGIISMVLGGGAVYILLLLPVEWNEVQITSTVRTKANQDTYQTLMEVYMSVELLTIALFLISYFVNRRYCNYKGEQALGWKYQVKENRKLIVSLLPCFATHSTLNVLMISGLYSYNLFYPEFDKVSVAFWIEIGSHVQMYALLMPVIIELRLRRENNVVVNCHLDSTAYFRQMVKDWEHIRSEVK